MASPAPVGTRPQRSREPLYTRDSNALRASVLDAALQLGVGTSRAVENLLFDSILEDDENITTPPLTSASAATSDESWPSVPAWRSIPTDLVLPTRSPPNVAPTPTFDAQGVRTPSEDSHASTVPRPPQHRKLRKTRKDVHESDGGYLSDNSKKKTDNKHQKKGSGLSIEPEYQSDGGYLFDARKGGVDKKRQQKGKNGNKMSDELAADPSIKSSYKSTNRSRNPSDDGDLSDGGYLSEASVKKKKTFFRLLSRTPSVTWKEAPPTGTPPPVPALPPTPLSSSGNSTHNPIPYTWPDSAPVRTAPDESPDLTSSIPRKDWSPLPPSEIAWSTTRSLSVDRTSENFPLSSMSHEIARNSPVFPLSPNQEASSYVSRPHKPDTRALSPSHSREQAPSFALPAPHSYGVRFTPSIRSDSSDITFPVRPSPPAVTVSSGKPPPRPKTSPLTTTDKLKASPSFLSRSPTPPALSIVSPMPAQPNLRPFVSPTLPSTPSPLMLASSTSSLQRRPSPALSEFSIVSSSDFIVPSPRPRFFEDLPPPSPPPTCPLPDLPSSPSTPLTKRGRQPPFPARTRGALPVQGASRLIERKGCMQQEAPWTHPAEVQPELQATGLGGPVGDNVHGNGWDDDLSSPAERVALVPPSPPRDQRQEANYPWPDDEFVRPDLAQFYLYTPPSPSGSAGGFTKRPSPDVPDDERSTYTYSYPASSTDMRAGVMAASLHSDVHGYYFGESDRDEDGGAERQDPLHGSFFDDEPGRGMRTRMVSPTDALYFPEKIPPVPKIQPF